MFINKLPADVSQKIAYRDNTFHSPRNRTYIKDQPPPADVREARRRVSSGALRMYFEVANGEVAGEVLLFRNVSNAGHVRSKVMRGELDAAIIDASLVSLVFSAPYCNGAAPRTDPLQFRCVRAECIFLRCVCFPVALNTLQVVDLFQVLVAANMAAEKRASYTVGTNPPPEM